MWCDDHTVNPPLGLTNSDTLLNVTLMQQLY